MREKSSLFHKDGKTPLPIIAGPLQYSSAVASLDGSKLFVVGEQPRAELQRYDVRSRQFLPYLSSISAGQIDVSPDAQWVTYVSYPERSLWRSRADGSQRQQLTNPPMVADMPRWSADGKQIVFAGNLPGTISFKIFVIAADGGTPKELVSGEDTSDGDPNWAPDGSAIQFSRWPGGGSPNPSDFSLRRFDLKTKEVCTLPGSTGLFGPRWSPNGLYIAAVTVDQKKLMLFRVDAGRWSELTSGNEIELPNWSRDGQFVNFESSSENGSELLRVNISTRQVERLVNFKGIPRYLLITGNYWNGQAADGSPLIMRDVGSREIYALDMQWP